MVAAHAPVDGLARISAAFCAMERLMARSASGAWPVSDMTDAVQASGARPSVWLANCPQSCRAAG